MSSSHAVRSLWRGTPWRSRWPVTVVRWMSNSSASWLMVAPAWQAAVRSSTAVGERRRWGGFESRPFSSRGPSAWSSEGGIWAVLRPSPEPTIRSDPDAARVSAVSRGFKKLSLQVHNLLSKRQRSGEERMVSGTPGEAAVCGRADHSTSGASDRRARRPRVWPAPMRAAMRCASRAARLAPSSSPTSRRASASTASS